MADVELRPVLERYPGDEIPSDERTESVCMAALRWERMSKVG